jgi:mannan endo-1,4-beta-mannosidase
VLRAHQNIDYLTAHVWPLNWSWVDGKNLAGTWESGKAKVEAYLDTHIRLATAAGKPLVIEEFGFPAMANCMIHPCPPPSANATTA